MMRITRFNLWLIVLTVLFAAGSTARAQTWTPFGPIDVRYDFDLFAPPDVSAYPDWPHPNEGFFFQYERLDWAIRQPRETDIGVNHGTAIGYLNSPAQFDPTVQPVSNILVPYGNSLETNFLGAKQTWGNRFELGFMEDDKGWFVSILNINPQVQSYAIGSTGLGSTSAGLTIVFNDPQHRLLGFVNTNGGTQDFDLNANPYTVASVNNKVLQVFGRPNPTNNLAPTGSLTPTSYAGFTDYGDMVPLIPRFNTIAVENFTSLNGVELNRSWRLRTFHDGTVFEPFVGLRWLQFRDVFDVTATDTTGGQGTQIPVALPGTSFWDTTANNNMFGPQIGFRAEYSQWRFNLMAELRFMAACNFQSINLNGTLGSALDNGDTPQNVPYQLPRTSFHTSQFDETFAPVGELRTGVNFQLTKAFSVQAEYNMLLGTGISRASRRVGYTLPAMTIVDGAKNDPFFTEGISFGVTINR